MWCLVSLNIFRVSFILIFKVCNLHIKTIKALDKEISNEIGRSMKYNLNQPIDFVYVHIHGFQYFNDGHVQAFLFEFGVFHCFQKLF